MSSLIPYDENSAKVWIRYISKLLSSLYSNGNITVLILVIAYIYEFCVWKSHKGPKPLNVKDLMRLHDDNIDFAHMCNVLCILRNNAIHCPFNIEDNKDDILFLLSSKDFKHLIQECFPLDYEMFDEMLSSYSRWIFD